MKAMKIILFALGIIIALVLVIAAFLPSSVSISRSIAIQANAELVYYQVANLKNWEKWSPFEAEDMSSIYTGSDAEPGMTRDWTSKSKGDGHMEVISGVPGKEYHSRMSMANGNHGSEHWTFTTDSLNQTQVTWTFTFEDLNYPLFRLLGLVSETVMGPVFEQGLSQLKLRCDSIGYLEGITVSTFGPLVYASITDTFTNAEMQTAVHGLYFEILQWAMQKEFQPSGPSMAVFHEWNPDERIIFEAAFPIPQPLEAEGRVEVKSFGKQKVVKFMHLGNYSNLSDSHTLIQRYLEACGFEINGKPIEEYIISPETEPDSLKWQTAIYYPIL
jgi:effector-binding domain-containing protein